MRIDELSEETLNKMKPMRYDRIVEKHEGPFTWKYLLKESEPDDFFPETDPPLEPNFYKPEFVEIHQKWVLLPVGRGHHKNITFLHYFFSKDDKKLVVYLKDTTYDDDTFSSGFIAICDWVEPEKFFFTTLYHEWFIIDYHA
jgi:hypothetical protein